MLHTIAQKIRGWLVAIAILCMALTLRLVHLLACAELEQTMGRTPGQ